MTAPDLSPHEAGDGLSTSRRAFIGKTAAGVAAGGLVWAAPSILTLDAAAAGSCGIVQSTLSWNDATAAANLDGALPNSPAATTSGDTIRTAAMNGVQATVNYTNPNGRASSAGTGSLGSCFSVISNEVGGNQPPNGTKSWYMQMNAVNVNDRVTTSFEFRKAGVPIAVNGLSFPMYDVDRVDGNGTLWTDRVVVSGTRNGVAVTVGVTKTGNGANSPQLTGINTNNAQAQGGGNSNIDPTATGGNVQFTFNGPVDTVLITYSAPEANHLPSTPIQFVGLGNLTWTGCT